LTTRVKLVTLFVVYGVRIHPCWDSFLFLRAHCNPGKLHLFNLSSVIALDKTKNSANAVMNRRPSVVSLSQYVFPTLCCLCYWFAVCCYQY